jgi:DNA-binding NtrC family response regulator
MRAKMSALPKPAVAVADADEPQCRKFCAMLKQLDYPVTPLFSRLDLEAYLQNHPDGIVILDVDTGAADNRFFRELKRRAPGVHLLALSSRSYHPGLEEALGSHIYACLTKPLDLEEFHYWIKSIAENKAARRSAEP